jgi:hypothetical protein
LQAAKIPISDVKKDEIIIIKSNNHNNSCAEVRSEARDAYIRVVTKNE